MHMETKETTVAPVLTNWPIKDSTQRIYVSAECIAEGGHGPHNCAIALACQQAGFHNAAVGSTMIVLQSNYDKLIFMSHDVRYWINQFDSLRAVPPFTLVIRDNAAWMEK
jgi:hypothetical protein